MTRPSRSHFRIFLDIQDNRPTYTRRLLSKGSIKAQFYAASRRKPSVNAIPETLLCGTRTHSRSLPSPPNSIPPQTARKSLHNACSLLTLSAPQVSDLLALANCLEVSFTFSSSLRLAEPPRPPRRRRPRPFPPKLVIHTEHVSYFTNAIKRRVYAHTGPASHRGQSLLPLAPESCSHRLPPGPYRCAHPRSHHV